MHEAVLWLEWVTAGWDGFDILPRDTAARNLETTIFHKIQQRNKNQHDHTHTHSHY